jgi:hypothetical protein
MRNKKADMFAIIGGAILGLILLSAFIGPVIKDIFIDRQVAFAGGQTEEITIDCDGDGAKGFSDQCPCDPENKELDIGKPCKPDTPYAKEFCPELCK